ncbi:hypothetical protein CC1G_11820 [Coprinopsis cinerea okayama7|uniref:Uncharacterized protein n=1 Tax=Coprinopsis cinerea (strain Okayama-7 / 130 / ATCC MYA-4618 / FGSC 9003) TaxID=240176 RepID=A8N5S2_COPC7|nr:hypothetical protein CC1G_11820 [Coprinopsis cinerea okayama7\|eukprot:XP_001830217.2 hypothetical protein CC1G_11820 [Coprinopsis cinerea okayama7\
MSSPYGYSPRIPAPPNPTPLRTSASARLGSRSATRPPIQNPFDKFNQREFDSWIGGITSALRKALGQEDVEAPETNTSESAGPTTEPQGFGFKDVDMGSEPGDESIFEDSFADFKARRIAKGKARDPREGPGLGGEGWNKDEPIELLSDDDEEEESTTENILTQNQWDEEEDEDPNQGEELEYYEDEEEAELNEEEGEQEYLEDEEELRPRDDLSPSRTQYRRWKDSASRSGASSKEAYGGDDDEEEFDERELETRRVRQQQYYVESADQQEPGSDSDDQIHEDEEDELEYDVEEGDAVDARSSPIEIVDDEEEEEPEELSSPAKEPEPVDRPSPPRIISDDDTEEDIRSSPPVEAEATLNEPEELQRDHSPSLSNISQEDLQYPEDDEVQPLEDDTSFPPHKEVAEQHDFTIRDPWSGPRMFAEDFYSGGDRAIFEGVTTDPDVLGDELAVERSGKVDADQPQKSEDLTLDNGFEAPIELPDVWEGPRNLAEDFYSGGDFKAEANGALDPHLLEEEREKHLGSAAPSDIQHAQPEPQSHSSGLFTPEEEPPNEEQDEAAASALVQPLAESSASFAVETMLDNSVEASNEAVRDVSMTDLSQSSVKAKPDEDAVEISKDEVTAVPVEEQQGPPSEPMAVETAPSCTSIESAVPEPTSQPISIFNGARPASDAIEFEHSPEPSPAPVKRYKVEIEEVTDEDEPESSSSSKKNVEEVEIIIEPSKAAEDPAPVQSQTIIPEEEMQEFSIVEPQSVVGTGEEFTDEDADGEEDTEDIEILSVSSGVDIMGHVDHSAYDVEVEENADESPIPHAGVPQPVVEEPSSEPVGPGVSPEEDVAEEAFNAAQDIPAVPEEPSREDAVVNDIGDNLSKGAEPDASVTIDQANKDDLAEEARIVEQVTVAAAEEVEHLERTSEPTLGDLDTQSIASTPPVTTADTSTDEVKELDDLLSTEFASHEKPHTQENRVEDFVMQTEDVPVQVEQQTPPEIATVAPQPEVSAPPQVSRSTKDEDAFPVESQPATPAKEASPKAPPSPLIPVLTKNGIHPQQQSEPYPASLSTPREAGLEAASLSSLSPLPPASPKRGRLSPESKRSPVQRGRKGTKTAVDEGDPFKLMGTGMNVFPAESKDDGVEAAPSLSVKSPLPQVEKPKPAAVPDVFGPDQDQQRAAAVASSSQSTPASTTKAGKRKRKAKPRKKQTKEDNDSDAGQNLSSIHVPRKRKAKDPVKVLASRVNKAKKTAPPSTASTASGSSASSAARLLQPSSRASSVVSTGTNDTTEHPSQPSPTVYKPMSAAPPPNPHDPWVHVHGQKRKQLQMQFTLPTHTATHVPRAAVVSPSFSKMADRASPLSPTTPVTATHAAHLEPPQTHTRVEAPQRAAPVQAATATASSSTTPTTTTNPARRSHTWTSTPVTRSHCRFHKISIPRDEEGPRLYFIVPGCSLTKEETIQEEDIVDHGDATYQDSQRMIPDVDSIEGLPDYIINVLRLLVGTEIFREGEIFYLPLPGEEVVHRRSAHGSSSFGHFGRSAPNGSSNSTLSGVLKRDLEADARAAMGNTDSESSEDDNDSDYEEKAPKKARRFRMEKAGDVPQPAQDVNQTPGQSGASRTPNEPSPLIGHQSLKRARQSIGAQDAAVLDDGARPVKKIKEWKQPVLKPGQPTTNPSSTLAATMVSPAAPPPGYEATPESVAVPASSANVDPANPAQR